MPLLWPEELGCTWIYNYPFLFIQNTEKGTSRQRPGKGAIRKRFPLQKPRREKTKPTIRYLYHENIS